MRRQWLASLGLLLAVASSARSQDVVWRSAATPLSAGTPSARAAPLVSLGEPIAAREPQTVPTRIQPVAYTPTEGQTGRLIVRGQAPDPSFPPVPGGGGGAPPPIPGPPPPIPGAPPYVPAPGGVPWSPTEQYNNAVVTPPSGPGFWDKCKNLFDVGTGPGGRTLFMSDHAFPEMISPVSNPFFFEDPRALTEARPIFIYQSIPKSNYALQGGNTEFFGVQARVAITDNWSLVMNKLGGVWLNPGSGALPGYEGGSSFAELDLGPKWTFLRNEQTKTVAAFGVTFQIPAGSEKAFQDTGPLGIVPYLSMAQNFWRTSYGSMNALGTLGYNFFDNRESAEFLFLSLHLDYDVANLHKIFPLFELNWTHYTVNGTSNDQTFEGRDLFNFGATEVAGHNTLTLATGLRYKFNECYQVGTAVEFPVTGRDLMDFRWTVDFIFRY